MCHKIRHIGRETINYTYIRRRRRRTRRGCEIQFKFNITLREFEKMMYLACVQSNNIKLNKYRQVFFSERHDDNRNGQKEEKEVAMTTTSDEGQKAQKKFSVKTNENFIFM